MNGLLLRTGFNTLPPGLRGLAWMFLGTISFSTMVVLVRHVSMEFSPFEIALWRTLFGLILMAPWLMRVKLRGLHTARPFLHAWRHTIHLIGVVAWYFAVSEINLSLGISLQFTVPLITIAIAMIFVGERADPARLVATLIGFSGVLIALRPWAAEVSAVALITLASAVFYALSNVLTKVLSRTDSSDVIVFHMNLMQLPLAFAGALALGFSIPGLWDLPWLFAVAASATLAHYFLSQALRTADAGIVMPVDFLKLPLIASLAYLAFGQIPDYWSWPGGAVIFAATYYILRREVRRPAAAGAAKP